MFGNGIMIFRMLSIPLLNNSNNDLINQSKSITPNGLLVLHILKFNIENTFEAIAKAWFGFNTAKKIIFSCV